tara:strand:+ start:254 stop:730 length:477 start_codon:yes stop_codon:yes gene_type:complete
MSGDKNEGVVGCFLWMAILLLTLLLFIPVIGPIILGIILITLSLIAIIYAFIESISKRIKSSNRRREMLLNEKKKKLEFSESVNHPREEKARTNLITNQVEITGSTKKSNIIPKQQKNRRKIICNKCGALFEENSLNCAYCGSELKIKKYPGIKRRLL